MDWTLGPDVKAPWVAIQDIADIAATEFDTLRTWPHRRKIGYNRSTSVSVVVAKNQASRNIDYLLAPADRRAIDAFTRTHASLPVLTRYNKTARSLRVVFNRRLPLREGHTRSAFEKFVDAIAAGNADCPKLAAAVDGAGAAAMLGRKRASTEIMMSDDGARKRHLAIFGGYGVVGTGIVSHLLDRPEWHLTTIGRAAAPARLIDGRSPPRHLQADLLDGNKAAAALASLSDVTDMVFCAYVERETMVATVAPNLAMLAHAFDALEAARAPLRRVVLIGGGKSYGEHLGPYKTPAKERDPRHLGPIFYNDQEDLLRERAKASGFAWTVLRPDGVLGPSIGSPMNMLMGIGAYAAICREVGVPLRFPGSLAAWSALHQATDAGVLANAVEWALMSPSASGEVFNVTNGDNFRWQHVWPEIADVFQIDVAPPQTMNLGEQMADKAALWQRMVDRHGLLPIAWEKLAAWPFVDAWFTMSYDMVQSTIKIRQAGFNTCIDTHDALVTGLQKLRHHRVLP